MENISKSRSKRQTIKFTLNNPKPLRNAFFMRNKSSNMMTDKCCPWTNCV